MRTSRMEINTGYPIFVTLASHNIFLSFHVKNFPSAIVTRRCNNLLSHVKCHTTYTSGVRLNPNILNKSWIYNIIFTWQERIRSCIFRERSSFSGSFSKLRYTKCIKPARRVFRTFILSLVSQCKLFLNFLFSLLYLIIDIMHSSLKFVLFKFKHSFFFYSCKILLFHIFNSFHELFSFTLHVFDWTCYSNFFSINTVLMVFVKIPLLS